jgi:hypothetical protein
VTTVGRLDNAPSTVLAEGAGTASRIGTYPSYSGNLLKVNSSDIQAIKLAERIKGQASVKFANDQTAREFDAISNLYVAQTKVSAATIGSSMRNQMKATFEAAINTGRTPYFHFDSQPGQAVLNQLNEYSERYGIEYVLDLVPLK